MEAGFSVIAGACGHDHQHHDSCDHFHHCDDSDKGAGKVRCYVVIPSGEFKH